MHLLFIAQVFIDFQITERAVNIYCDILRFGHPAFKKWPYLHCQLAVAFHNKRGKDGKIIFIQKNNIFVHYYF